MSIISNIPYYDLNVAILKKYGNDYKLIRLNAVLKKGFERENVKPRGSVNNKKLANNISRAKQKIFEYAKCNEWQFFCTFTLDQKKYDRYDLGKYIKDLGKFINNQNRYREQKIKYVIIPEQHKDGAWHLHALFSGLQIKKELKRYTREDFENKIPLYILDRINKDKPLYKWQKYQERFGYCILDPVRSQEAISRYVVKYINKGLSQCVTELNAKMYYVSHGLNKAVEVKRGRLNIELSPDFENEYVKINWLDWMDNPADAETIIDDDRELLRNCKGFNRELNNMHSIKINKIKDNGWLPLSPELEKQINEIFN